MSAAETLHKAFPFGRTLRNAAIRHSHGDARDCGTRVAFSNVTFYRSVISRARDAIARENAFADLGASRYIEINARVPRDFPRNNVRHRLLVTRFIMRRSRGRVSLRSKTITALSVRELNRSHRENKRVGPTHSPPLRPSAVGITSRDCIVALLNILGRLIRCFRGTFSPAAALSPPVTIRRDLLDLSSSLIARSKLFFIAR